MIRVLFHHGLDLDPVFARGAALDKTAAGKLLVPRKAFFFTVVPAVIAKRFVLLVPETGIGTHLVLTRAAMGHALAEAAFAKIPVVQLGIIRAVRPDVGLAARTKAEAFVKTLPAIDPAIRFRHGASRERSLAVVTNRRQLLKTIPAQCLARVLKAYILRFFFAAVRADFLYGNLRRLQNLNIRAHGTSPFRVK